MVSFIFAKIWVFKNSLKKPIINSFILFSFIYFLGMAWLGSLIGWDKPIFQLGAQPFLLAELFKILIVTFAVNKIKKIRKFI